MLAAVKVEVNDPNLVEDLLGALRDTRCVVVQTGPRLLEVRSGWPTEGDGGRYELDGFLRVWEAVHPGASATRVD